MKTNGLDTTSQLKLTIVELEFLKESNAIEREYSADDLYQAALAWCYLKTKKALTTSTINEAHRLLTFGKGLGRNSGNFRDCQVYISNHVPPTSYMVPHLVANWFLDHGTDNTPEAIKQAHILFETIHPYIDGNGRIGRMLLNWQRLRAKLPILVIEEAKKQDYYHWFDGQRDFTNNLK